MPSMRRLLPFAVCLAQAIAIVPAHADALPLSINLGGSPNDRSGDPARTAFGKIMDAVNALYAARVDVALNVKEKGAKLDGTDDTAALQAARAAAPVDGTILVPPGQWQRTADPTAGPASPVLWQMSGNKYGASSVPVINLGKDTVESYFGGTKYFGRGTSSDTVGPVVRIDGALTQATGSGGNRSVLEVNASNGTAAAPGQAPPAFLWGITSKLESFNHNTEATSIYAQAIKRVSGGGVFGFVSETHDASGQSSAIGGPTISAEIDLTANGADNCPAPASGCRIMLDMVVAQSPTIGGDVGKNEVGTVMQIGARPNEGSIRTVFRSANATPVTDSVLDTTGFVLPGNAVALKLAPGHRIAFDGRTNDGGFSRTLSFFGGLLAYTGPNGVTLTVDDAGSLAVVGKITAAAGLNAPDLPAPTSSSDPRGAIGDVIFSGPSMYRKTTSGWLRFPQGATF